MKQSTMNRVWAKLVLMSLQRAGVTDVCIAPGSRSTPLTLEAEALREEGALPLNIHTHFDERGLGFLALGLAKASEKPVAVIVTSGTAVANLLPAVAESRLTREKLILLTADRPTELIQCGANQAISQRGIFGDHADTVCDLPSPSELTTPAWLLSTLDESLHQQSLTGGSLHINCPYPEPLYGELEDTSEYLAPVAEWLRGQTPYLSFVSAYDDELVLSASFINEKWYAAQQKKGVLIVGRVNRKDRAAIQALADKLAWPILCDPQAGMGSDFAGFDGWMQNPACAEFLAQAECVLQFGARLVSKRLGQFLDGFHGEYWLLDEHPGRLDPRHRKATRIIGRPVSIASQLSHTASEILHAGWAAALSLASKAYLECVNQHALKNEQLSELAMAADFPHWLHENSDVFIGNSLAIRLLDMCVRLPERHVYANRGASGIDGLIATASGVQRAQQKPMVCLMGDTSALYDLNSLALLAHNPYPLVVIVVNNDGGGIFDMLPVPQQSKDAFYRMPHGFEFSHAAAMFGLQYQCPTTLEAARFACLEGQKHAGTTLIELRVPAGESCAHLNALFTDIAKTSLF
ncbi:2-succinyl-5-enolpyruvyl-6-hydroxy-3-cyclohexene-1-carboxylic-acid synthase [Enterovibrio norvegicus]|uniref:2-succinyl-5-enolpyruvyl-6-hydroxy-3- cyclohexene-1-carboxylic-acid synthase n=1 Tax=Enterovibrio norvegicus TaxID=188144 RepID=UPI0002FA8FC5|nr:2-succinyl-5-enolpyruvyl-6-hydroxy-3-cyclohexene-1-carboxylic-acid synthase [Enterovibrio norvegicus]OEF52124.1 2-succinyl-5-enolpyruvyl-6-hydroxy-3-cyclohexene-1-carboxylic-acid synthase [Enterovibrio norvegicus]